MTAQRAHHALERAMHRLLSLQSPEGWWKGDLDSNVTMDAEDLMLRQFLGVLGEDQSRASARWIRSQQRADGSWGNYPEGPAELSTTVEAYVALRLAGDPPGESHMTAAAQLVRKLGGIERTRVFTRIWLALFGLWDWRRLPALPPEMILLPQWCPLNIYDFGCWARQTIVPLTIVRAHRPVRPLPFGVDELHAPAATPPRTPLATPAGLMELLDRALRLYERRPLRRLRGLALRLATEWIVHRQEADGSWGGIQPPWVYSLIALELQGYGLDHPVMRRGLDGLDSFTLAECGSRRLEACQSPVWDTALALVALTDAGVASSDPAIIRAVSWLLDKEVRVRGDWAVRRPDLAPGGWSFEFANVHYPDVDDAAEVTLALRAAGGPLEPAIEAAVKRAVDWVLGMQSRDGGWAAFDADNTRELCRQIPFADFGEVIDPPSADVTAHALEMLAAEGHAAHPAAVRGRDWLLRNQEPDGSWFGRWGANHLYGTGACLPALIAAGVEPSAAPARRAVGWLHSVQNGDGGWGEDLRSYREPDSRGRGASTASQTAWALLALLASGERDSDSVLRGVNWLVSTLGEDGTWQEPQFTGTGFPGYFYIRYGLYRQIYPVMALGRYLRGRE